MSCCSFNESHWDVSAAALIMAGGQSSRMGATRGPLHKALVSVLGVTLLERNVLTLLGRGFRCLLLAVSAESELVARFAVDHVRPQVEAMGATLQILRESQPLGTIGIAQQFASSTHPLVIVNVDNLSTIDLRALVAFHQQELATLTIASHDERFQLPFGELVLQGSEVAEYREKSTHPIAISSGTYVLSPTACQAIERDERLDIPALFRRLQSRGLRTMAYRHDAAWIDINDQASVHRAEDLLRSNVDLFEHWPNAPDLFRSFLVLSSERGFLAITDSSDRDKWRLPSTELCRQDGLEATPSRHCWTVAGGNVALVASFDGIDHALRRPVRHFLFGRTWDGDQSPSWLDPRAQWRPWPPEPEVANGSVEERALAWFRPSRHSPESRAGKL